MSNQANTFWALSILAAMVAAREQRSLDAAREFFATQFPETAAALVVDTVGEVVEVAS